MRKTPASARHIVSPQNKSYSLNSKRGRGRPRLQWLVLLLMASFPVSVCAQDLRPGSESELAGRAQRALREQWFLRGRSSPSRSGAGQRYQAYLQKMRMRAARAARRQKLENAVPTALVWSPLGPSPLASDASGVGEYNYGWVSGRATAVAIDPADPTGSTVYIGGRTAEFGNLRTPRSR